MKKSKIIIIITVFVTGLILYINQGGGTTRIVVKRIINAPIEKTFRAISDIENLPDTNHNILKIEFLSDIHKGVGTRFRETRRMSGSESVTELEITEYKRNSRLRMVADSHGTIWDSVLTVKSVDAGTELTITMDANAHKFLPKLLNPLMKSLYKKGLEKHLDAVKAYCEKK